VVEGQHALRLSSKLTLTSLLTFNRYEVMPESRYVFPIAGTLFLDDFKYAVGVGAQVEEKLDVDVSDTTRLMFGFTAANCDIIPKATVPGGADPDQDIIEQAGKLTYYQQVDGVLVRTDLNRTTDYHYQQFGFYAEGSHRFNDLFRVIAGVRVDLSTRYDDVPVSPRAAAVFTGLGGRLTLKYVFQRAYVAPAPYFSYNIFDNGVRISKGNPDLRPEKALSNEVQVAWQDRQLLVTASAYYNHQSDLLITAQSELPDTEIGEVFVNADGTGRRTLTKSINLGTSNAYGFDVSSRYKSDRFSSWASYSYVDFQRKTGGIESGLGQISRHNVRAGLTLSVLRNLHVTPSLVFRSMPENLTATYDGLGVSLDNPYEVNLNLLYAPTRYLDVFATIRNLTDHHYALRGVSGPALQEPLSGWLGLRFAY
jgi:outer membrane receptor protein involved in Fe transport